MINVGHIMNTVSFVICQMIHVLVMGVTGNGIGSLIAEESMLDTSRCDRVSTVQSNLFVPAVEDH